MMEPLLCQDVPLGRSMEHPATGWALTQHIPEESNMTDPNHPDPYVDDVPHNPGDTIGTPEQAPTEPAPEWPEGQVPPEEQSDG